MYLAKSVPVKTPYLVSFRDPTIQTDNVLDRRSGGIATRISDKDRIWEPKPSDIGTAATNDEIKNIDTTVDGPTTDERNTASSRIVECTPKSIFRKKIKKFDSSSRMNLTKSVPVKTIDLVSFRNPTIQTDNVLD